MTRSPFKICFGGALALAPALFLAGCDNSSEPADTLVYGTTLADIGTHVIYPTYQDQYAKAQILTAVLVTLAADTTSSQALLDSAREAWKNARHPWEQSEGFAFGPVKTDNVDPTVDTWPLDSLALRGYLTPNATFDTVYVTSQLETTKGFHAMEYLLFGIDGNKTAASLSAVERRYLVAAGINFRQRIGVLKTDWDPAGGNYLGKFTTAGAGSTQYHTHRAALQELLDAMIDICDEVGTSKIADAYTEMDRTKEESRFSNNSTTDFSDNIRSVWNVYHGKIYGSAGAEAGVKALLAQKNAVLADTAAARIDAAIAALQNMGVFGTAIFGVEGRAKVAAAQTAVLKLRQTLDVQVRQALFD